MHSSILRLATSNSLRRLDFAAHGWKFHLGRHATMRPAGAIVTAIKNITNTSIAAEIYSEISDI